MERVSGKDLLIQELKHDIGKLEKENVSLKTEMQKEINRLKCEKDYVQYCLDETRKSFSYRLGMILTALPRKIREKKYLRENKHGNS